MRRFLIAMVAAAGGMIAGPAHAAYPTEDALRRVSEDAPASDLVAETEHYCLTLALFFEGGSTGEPEHGQRYIARVITERAKANRRIWGGPTICGVVFQKSGGVCQFSFACLPPERRTAPRNAAWSLSAAVAHDAMAGRNQTPHGLIRFYMNAELTPLKNICFFHRRLVRVTRAGRHEFFREPTAAERREMAGAEVEACTRYAALLAEQKAKSRKAHKRGKSRHKLAKLRGKAKVAKVGGKGRAARLGGKGRSGGKAAKLRGKARLAGTTMARGRR